LSGQVSLRDRRRRGSVPLGAVTDYLGPLAATLGLGRTGGRAHFSLAAAAHERIGAEWALAMTQLAWGRLKVARGGPTERETSFLLLERALDSARNWGYDQIERRATRAIEAPERPQP
jgi:hypothetical protein